METKSSAVQNWNSDGMLEIKDAQTIQRYLELKKEISEAPMDDFGIFFAFNTKQFEEGYSKLVESGRIKQGERVQKMPGGAFGIIGSFERLIEYYDNIEDKIRKECDPQEVYWYEYNNYECCIAYDGDKSAINHVISIFGAERCKSIRRFRDIYAFDEI